MTDILLLTTFLLALLSRCAFCFPLFSLSHTHTRTHTLSLSLSLLSSLFSLLSSLSLSTLSLSLFGSHLQLKRVMLRRLKESIQNLLSMKSESVVFCKMSSLQRRCYQRVLDSPDYQLLLRKDEPCDCGRPDQTRGKCCHGGGGGGGDSRNQKKLLKSKTKTKRSAGGILWQSQHQDINGRFVECDKCPSCLTLLCLPKLMQLCNHCELIKPVWKQVLFFSVFSFPGQPPLRCEQHCANFFFFCLTPRLIISFSFSFFCLV